MSNLPPIFLINLDKSIDRLQEAEQEFANTRFNFIRVPAVYGADLSSEEQLKHYCPELNKKQYYKKLTVGEIGCYLSHKNIWQRIVDEKIPYAIILEDDFKITGDVEAAIALLNKFPIDWDYIKLAGYKSRNRPTQFSSSLGKLNLTVFNKAMAGTCAQAVSLSGAKKLLESTNKFGRPIDTDIQHWWEKNISLFSLTPYPFDPDQKWESEISKMASRSSNIKKHIWRRKWQQLKFHFNNKHHTKKLVLDLKVRLAK